MNYESTRGSMIKKTGAQAIVQGIAEDKGLYVPECIPALPSEIKDSCSQQTGPAPRGCPAHFISDKVWHLQIVFYIIDQEGIGFGSE